MKKRVVVEIVSNELRQQRKWYQARTLLTGTDFAQDIQSVIEDYDHKGFRSLCTEQAYASSVLRPGDASTGESVPVGLLLFFESYD
ncbi:MAG: hypothetical protein D6772_03355 [Bacteroidetes bacterium]|nr:MAG: hypothetical protein D6772_03355 [Bacteroidota bacterium]